MKKVKIVAMAAGILLLTGCGKVATDVTNSTDVETKKGNETEETKNQPQDNDGGVTSEIKAAMASGKPMKCSYKINNAGAGEMVATSYFNGNKFKTEMSIMGNMQHMIFDSENIYSWGDGQKQGMQMTKKCMEELNKDVPKNIDEPEATLTDSFEARAFDGAMDVKCEGATNIDFSIPTDVTFADQCEMMKGMMNSIPGGTDIPAGADIPVEMPAGVPEITN